MNNRDSFMDESCIPITEWPVVAVEDESDAIKENSEQRSTTEKNLVKRQTSTFTLERMSCKRRCERDLSEIDLKKKEPMANTSIAKWWRRHGQYTVNRDNFPQSDNANTVLSAISRSPEGKYFIQEEVKRLDQLLKDDKTRADIHAALGSFLERLGHYDAAEIHLQRAVWLDPQDKDYRWLMLKVRKQLLIQKLQTEGLKELKSLPLFTDVKPLKTVLRVSADGLSLKEFFHKYAMTSTPVVITDMVSQMSSIPWTLDHVKEKVGNCMATVKRLVPESSEWARLEDCRSVRVSDFIDDLDCTDSRTDKMYLFDWSLPIHCPQLVQELTIPKYFANDFLQRTNPGSLYKDSWPSLFIAPKGLTSELHVDAFGSNFWMALFEGKKRWVFFPRKDLPFLYPTYEHSMDPVFDVDLSAPDLEKYPLMHLTEPIECVLNPGELLFVPAGCPHRVENLENSLAISANYVDLSNLELVKQELAVNGIIDERAEDIHHQITHEHFVTKMNLDIENLKWPEFKNWYCNKAQHNNKSDV